MLTTPKNRGQKNYFRFSSVSYSKSTTPQSPVKLKVHAGDAQSANGKLYKANSCFSLPCFKIATEHRFDFCHDPWSLFCWNSLWRRQNAVAKLHPAWISHLGIWRSTRDWSPTSLPPQKLRSAENSRVLTALIPNICHQSTCGTSLKQAHACSDDPKIQRLLG